MSYLYPSITLDIRGLFVSVSKLNYPDTKVKLGSGNFKRRMFVFP
jgi:hypothetical protein